MQFSVSAFARNKILTKETEQNESKKETSKIHHLSSATPAPTDAVKIKFDTEMFWRM